MATNPLIGSTGSKPQLSDFHRAVTEYNLCTWFILPLIGLNKFSFNEGNFIQSYLTRDGQYIAVEVTDRNLCAHVQFNEHYAGQKLLGEHELLLFVIPGAWTQDIDLFRQGRYSLMSEYAKKLIREDSGLTYRQEDADSANKRIDARLMALEKHPALKRQWQAELEVETPVKGWRLEIGDDLELLSIPSEDSYIEV
jgi:hypothetical protein